MCWLKQKKLHVTYAQWNLSDGVPWYRPIQTSDVTSNSDIKSWTNSSFPLPSRNEIWQDGCCCMVMREHIIYIYKYIYMKVISIIILPLTRWPKWRLQTSSASTQVNGMSKYRRNIGDDKSWRTQASLEYENVPCNYVFQREYIILRVYNILKY